ncbi:MAG TPA: hypothetical protein PLV68_21175, partial [Ilumatobacteraceae bacterium]|nr:hypothetical protein [Ilumatobacteraceae bacterium]
MRAVTTWLDADRRSGEFGPNGVDLNDVAGGDGVLFVRDGVGLAGRGVAARIGADEAVEFLNSLDIDDEVGLTGSGPVALGVLPFRPGAAAKLIVPA